MEVKINQVWEDVDKRRKDRTFKIEAILTDDKPKALVKVLSNSKKGPIFTKIKLNRFTPKYYKLTSVATQDTADDLLQDIDTDTVKGRSNLHKKCKETFSYDNIDSDIQDISETSIKFGTGSFSCVINENIDLNNYVFSVYLNGIMFDSWIGNWSECLDKLNAWFSELQFIAEDCIYYMLGPSGVILI